MLNSIWRLQVRTDGEDEQPIGKYCINNKVAAIGWSFYYNINEKQIISLEERERIGSDFSRFRELANIHNLAVVETKSKYKLDSVRRMACDVKTGDIIWLRSYGLYYIGRVSEFSKWTFNANKDATEHDASNQISNIQWYLVGDESEVPGAINTAFIRGSAIQRIHKEGIKEFSGLLYDKLAKSSYYSSMRLKNTQESFYNLMLTADAEDLLCLWLYYEFGYICIPSTNKVATPLYECVLLDTNSGGKVYVQVKKGDQVINASEYKDLSELGEVWLFQTEGKVIGDPNLIRIKVALPSVLYAFAFNEKSRNYLSPSISRWVDIIKENESLIL